MTIDKTQENGKLILALHGRLDTITSPRLQEALIPALDEAKEVLLDFSNVAYISSAGLRVLLVGQKTANAKGASLSVSGVSEEVMEVLDMTGFSDILTIV